MLTHRKLRSLLHYDPRTGKWTWKIDRGPMKAGERAGSINPTNGRWMIGVEYGRYLSSRLAWFYMTGKWPKRQVDHIDRNPLNDRWCNLRQATQSQNNANKHSRGVRLYRNGKYSAQITVNGKFIHLGYFRQRGAAAIAYQTAARKHFGEFAR